MGFPFMAQFHRDMSGNPTNPSDRTRTHLRIVILSAEIFSLQRKTRF
jgi:hypothetical protein